MSLYYDGMDFWGWCVHWVRRAYTNRHAMYDCEITSRSGFATAKVQRGAYSCSPHFRKRIAFATVGQSATETLACLIVCTTKRSVADDASGAARVRVSRGAEAV